MAHSEQVIEKIIEMKDEGVGSRTVALEVLGSKSKKSTVNDIYKRELLKRGGQVKETEQPEWALDEGVLNVLTESPDVDVASLAKRLRSAQKSNSQLRKIHRETVDPSLELGYILEGVKKAVKGVNLDKVYHTPLQSSNRIERPDNCIVEVLFSDFQIGKSGQYYNTELAEKAIKRYGEEVMKKIYHLSATNNVEKIVLAMLGDTVEDHLKHGVQSATSTDSGLAEQISNAIKMIWKYVIQPLVSYGVEVEVICIAGNHGSSQHKGMDMYKAGLFSYDYPIYKSLELLCEESGYDNIQFIIPEGVFGYTSIYGNWVVYEHGYFNTSTEKSMEDQMKKRGQQMKRHVEYFRCGDMHHSCVYDCGKIVLNGAFFGVDTTGVEYSGILGFSSVPSQTLLVHKPERSLGRNTVKEVNLIQVADGY